MKLLAAVVSCLGTLIGSTTGEQRPMPQAPTGETVAELLSTAQGRAVDPQYLHLVPVLGVPGLMVVGEQVTTHSDDLRGVVLWGEEGVRVGSADEMVADVMGRAGWPTADAATRCDLAMRWARSVELQFAGAVEDHELAVFGIHGRPGFEAPATRSPVDGGVEVTLWYREVERGKSSTQSFCRLELVFSEEGRIPHRSHGPCFSVPNQEWREALAEKPRR